MGNSLQDLLIRYNRQKGKTTLWLPGCDHAGIATQSVVEKMLWKRKRQTRHDLGREKLVNLVRDWKDEYHQKINNAFRKMGSSLDWGRETFTMVSIITYAFDLTLVLITGNATGRELFRCRHRDLGQVLRRGDHLPGQPSGELGFDLDDGPQ